MLTCFGNLLDADRTARERVRAVARAAVDVATETGVGLVCTFPGRDDGASEDDNYRQLADYYGPLTEQAARGNVKIILENWPGPRVNYLATTPAGWARLFELVPAPNLGLNFDPSHLVWQGIDHEPALRPVADRVFLAHAKDTEIFPEALQQTGYFGKGWWTYRLPGHGRIDWGRWLGLLREVGFDGVVSIEHEDRDYGAMRGPLARRREGLLEAQRVLRENMK
jgi:sugar phosphate isomerase/epimerase